MRGAGRFIAVVVVSMAGCAAKPIPTDYTAFIRHMPSSILVLPPVNRSAAVEAPDLFLATITRPLAERGYYVFPIAVVDRLLKDSGAPTPGEMHRIPLKRLTEILDADAVMYIEIEKWTTSYVVIETHTRVVINYRLVDTATGRTLWTRTIATGESSAQYAGDNAGGVILALFMAQVQAVGAAISDPEVRWARRANHLAFDDRDHGLLPGPRHPEFATDQRLTPLERGPPGRSALAVESPETP